MQRAIGGGFAARDEACEERGYSMVTLSRAKMEGVSWRF